MSSFYDIQARKNMSVVAMKDISASDTADLPDGPTRGIFCTESGDATVIFYDGDTQTLPFVEGTLYSFCLTRVNLTGLTATLKACY